MKHILILTCSLLIFTSCMKGIAVDTVIHNARIHVMDDDNTVHEAIAIKDGKVVEVGPERQILNKYSADEYIDVQKKDVYPGWVDAHGHILNYARQQISIDLTGCKSFNEIITRIEKYQARHNRPYIIGRGWDQSLWGRDEMPNNTLLNEKFPDIPVCLFRIDGHACLVNNYLIEKSDVIAKYHADSELNQGGHYETIEKDGALDLTDDIKANLEVPSGVFVDNAMNPILEILPDFPEKELRESILAVQEELYEYGITGVHEAGLTHEELALVEDMVNKNELEINIYGMLLPSEENYAFAKKHGIYTNKNLLVRSFKVYGDGAMGSRGAFLKQSYADRHGHFGYLTTSLSRMNKIANFCHDVNYQMNTHAIGDSTNRILTDIYMNALNFNQDHRWRIEHAQVVDPRDFELFAKARIFPSVQPTHATSDQRWAADRLGEHRMEGAYAYKSLLDNYGMLAIGTDFPVEFIDPFRTIHSAVNRKDTKNFPEEGFLPAESITLEECIRGMTIWAAYASFQEDQLGTLEEGKDATLSIFMNPVAANAAYTPNYAYITMIKGKKVYSVE